MYNALIFLTSVGGAAGIVAVVLTLPPLTNGGGSARLPDISEAALQEAVTMERTFCDSNDLNVDCACFAEKSGIVRSAAGPRINGAVYADQTALARGQAAESC